MNFPLRTRAAACQFSLEGNRSSISLATDLIGGTTILDSGVSHRMNSRSLTKAAAGRR